MPRPHTIHDYWVLQTKMATMMLNAQTVIGMRMLGMAGLWPVTAGENDRMVSEKSTAFAKAATAAWGAALSGKRPDQVTSAWLAPISRRAASNQRRLSGRRKR
ncbi:hypothetical protein SAMN04490244_106236 [Tranquillimonas rosea]|uniref:Antifreeze protein n=1 Tax=Tranquillimonas rosea TaxID=641238 RepID=A0A1H9V449_9RHOB|nr:hypothetical protein [Tranquillimonas rosea]SES16495.1 hypothetical protein SAMN04490244_106236 [Tranquillimonas rosea]